MRYVPPRERSGRSESILARVRRQMLMEEARHRTAEKPFDPEAPRERYASAHHFAVNGRWASTEGRSEREQIVDGMARTFYVTAWADAMEEAGIGLSGELMDQAPETTPEAYELAEKAARRIEDANHTDLESLYEKMLELPQHPHRSGRHETRFDFGYCLAMMYMGSGVSWFDDHPGDSTDLDVPYGEGMYLDPSELDLDDYRRNAAPECCRVCGDRLPPGEHGLCERHLTEPMDERWNDAPSWRSARGGGYSDPSSRLDAMHTLNPRGGPRGVVDQHAADELVLFIENTRNLSVDGPSGQGHSIKLNLIRKWRKGTYDFELSVKLFGYLAESGAKAYVAEMGHGTPVGARFNVPTRLAAAREMATSFRDRLERGEYDDVDARIGR